MYMRDSLRGRSTTVYDLEGMDPWLFSVRSSTYVAVHVACTTDTPVAGMLSQTLTLRGLLPSLTR